jgi:hypothetical protein
MQLEEAKKYISKCVDKIGRCFNPDDKPKDYINKETRQNVLTHLEAEEMETKIYECCICFEENNICIYGFCSYLFNIKHYI